MPTVAAARGQPLEREKRPAQHEVVEPYRRIERATGRAPRIGAWRGGTRFDAAQLGNRTVAGLGLTHLVSNWSVERV